MATLPPTPGCWSSLPAGADELPVLDTTASPALRQLLRHHPVASFLGMLRQGEYEQKSM